MYDDTEDVDFTIVTATKEFPVHKVIIKTKSAYLKAMTTSGFQVANKSYKFKLDPADTDRKPIPIA